MNLVVEHIVTKPTCSTSKFRVQIWRRWPHLLRKYKGICFQKLGYANIGKPLILGETAFTIGFAAPMFPIQCTTFVELWLQQMGVLCKNPNFTMEIFNVGLRLEIFGPKYQKAHPYAKSGRINRLAYVPVALFCTAPRKSTQERPLETRVICNTASLPHRHD